MVHMFSKKHTYKINIRTPTTLNNKNLAFSFAYTLGLRPQLKGFLNLIFIIYLLFRFSHLQVLQKEEHSVTLIFLTQHYFYKVPSMLWVAVVHLFFIFILISFDI